MLRIRWAVLVLLLSGCAVPGPSEAPRTSKPSEYWIPPAQVPPLGYCRIWYAELSPERQPPHMTCGRAHEIAQRHGGRVVAAISRKSFQDGRTLGVDYGPSSLAEVPAAQLPAPGLCRAWYGHIPPERQPPAMQCKQAEQLVRSNGGRLLYMPDSDLK